MKYTSLRVITYAAPLVLFILMALQMIELPGLYMDAINPEYMIAEIINSENPVFDKWLLPGNVIGGRFPVFSGPMYHGSLQVYATLPFLYVFGIELHVFRYFQVAVGLSVVLLTVAIAKRVCVEGKFAQWIPLVVGLLVATDPILIFGLRTQAYSLIFPLPLMLLSWILLDMHLHRSTTNLEKYALPFASGFLIGFAVFSYFVYAFFIPVIFLFLVSGSVNHGNFRFRFQTATIWIVGVLIGVSGFFVGLVLLIKSLGGVNETLQWWGGISPQLKVLGESQNFFERTASVATDFHSVVNTDWLFRTILKEYHEIQLLVWLKWVLFAFSAYAAFALGKSRLYKYLLASLLGYLGAALIFGGRLSGHHYTLLVPIVYFSIAVSGGFLFVFRDNENKSVCCTVGVNLILKSLWAVGVIAIFCFNLVLGDKFLARMDTTGGGGLYSDAINKFSKEILERDIDSMVYMPDWGYRMPFAFLTKGLVEYNARVDPFRIYSNSCANRASFVVFDGDDNDEKFELIKTISTAEEFSKTQWKQRNGEIAFEVGKFFGNAGCEDIAHLQESPRQISVMPSALYSCDFIGEVTAQVSWDFQAAGVSNVSVYVSEDGKNRTLWTSGASSGIRDTGPWAKGGIEFIFIDAKTGVLLDSVSIENISCPMTENQDIGQWAKPRKRK